MSDNSIKVTGTLQESTMAFTETDYQFKIDSSLDMNTLNFRSGTAGRILSITPEGNLIFAEHLSKDQAAVEFLKCLNCLLTAQGKSAIFEIKDEPNVG